MQIQKLINSLFRQNFKDRSVLGRALFGLSMFLLGWAHLLDISSFASAAPSYIPLANIAVIIVGIVLVVAGFLMAANLYVTKAAHLLGALFTLFILIVYLPQGRFLEILAPLAYLGAAMYIAVTNTPSTEGNTAN